MSNRMKKKHTRSQRQLKAKQHQHDLKRSASVPISLTKINFEISDSDQAGLISPISQSTKIIMAEPATPIKILLQLIAKSTAFSFVIALVMLLFTGVAYLIFKFVTKH